MSWAEIFSEYIFKSEDKKPDKPPAGFYRDEAGWLRPINPMGY